MSERSETISKLKISTAKRKAYIRAKLGTLVPSQIRALRIRFGMARQADLAVAAGMHQSRISMFETPGANFTLETLSRIAAALHVGVVVKFVPFSEMLRWDNSFSQDRFTVTRLEDDGEFLGEESSIKSQAEGSTSSIYVQEVTAESRSRPLTQAGTINPGLLRQVNAGLVTNGRQATG